MAKNKAKTDAEDGGLTSLQELVKEYVRMCRVLGLQVAEDVLTGCTEEQLQERIDVLQPTYDEEISRQAEATDQAEAPTKVEPIAELIVKAVGMGSGRRTIIPPDVNKTTGARTPGIEIIFPDDFKDARGNPMFHSQYWSPKPTVLSHYGSKELVLGIIKAKIDEDLNFHPGKYEYLTQAQFDGARAEKGVVDRTTKVVSMALSNPEDPEAKKLFAAIKEYETTHPVVGFVQSGPANVGSFAK